MDTPQSGFWMEPQEQPSPCPIPLLKPCAQGLRLDAHLVKRDSSGKEWVPVQYCAKSAGAKMRSLLLQPPGRQSNNLSREA